MLADTDLFRVKAEMMEGFAHLEVYAICCKDKARIGPRYFQRQRLAPIQLCDVDIG